MNLLKSAPSGRRDGATLGIRPEHIDVVADSGWDVRVETCELLGAERLIYARLGEEPMIIRVEEQGAAPKPDEMIRVRPREDRIHWFDGASGKRI